jgi:hypothetical protein
MNRCIDGDSGFLVQVCTHIRVDHFNFGLYYVNLKYSVCVDWQKYKILKDRSFFIWKCNWNIPESRWYCCKFLCIKPIINLIFFLYLQSSFQNLNLLSLIFKKCPLLYLMKEERFWVGYGSFLRIICPETEAIWVQMCIFYLYEVAIIFEIVFIFQWLLLSTKICHND